MPSEIVVLSHIHTILCTNACKLTIAFIKSFSSLIDFLLKQIVLNQLRGKLFRFILHAFYKYHV